MKEVEYKGYVIEEFKIDKIVLGDKEYDGWTSYFIKNKKNGAVVACGVKDGEIIYPKLRSVKSAKAFITKKIKKREAK